MKGFGIPCKKMKRYFQKITYLHKNACSSFIIYNKIIIRISDERVSHFLQENEVIFSKYFSKILDWIFEKKVFA